MDSLTDHDPASLAALFEQWGFRPVHARTLLRAFYESNGRVDLAPLRLGKQLGRQIELELPLRQSRIVRTTSSADGTHKFLIEFDRGGAAEAVLMPAYDPARAAACISSQIGCAMGCDFCASTLRGLERNLSAGEITDQFLHLREQAALQGRRLTTLVYMGMGEPLSNLDSVIASVPRIAAPHMGNLGPRQITISTVGLVPQMDRLAEADLNVHLALSLHAPDDPTRSRIVPMNRKYGVAAVMDAAKRFQERTGRIVTIEYCLLAGVNDSDDHARELTRLMKGFRAHVNLIPFNPIGASVSGMTYIPPSDNRVERFLQILRDGSVVAHARRPRGQSIAAACGQLRESFVASA